MSNNRSDNLEELAARFKALSNPNRLKIFQKLARCCPPGTVCTHDEEQVRSCVGEVGRDLGIAASTISHHVKELNQAGLIRMERRGQTIECWIDPENLKRLSAFFMELCAEQLPNAECIEVAKVCCKDDMEGQEL